MKGLFVALEGGEGSGKSTQMKLLKESLSRLYPGREFIFTREPGGSPFAEAIRNLILHDQHASGASGAVMVQLSGLNG